MIIWNPRKWDIIGKLKWLEIAFLTVIIVSVLIVGGRWMFSGSSASELKITFKDPIAAEESKIVETVSKLAIDNKLENISVNIPAETADFKAKTRILVQATSIDQTAASAIAGGIKQELQINEEGTATISNIKIPGQPFNWGLDFTGGTIMDITFKNNFTENSEPMSDEKVIATVRGIFAKNGVPINSLQVQRNVADEKSGKTWANAILVRTQESSDAKRQAVITALSDKAVFGEVDKEKLRIDTIGPVVGQELKNKMVTALLWALALIFIYISIRFQPRAAVAAIACLIHDALFVFAILAATNVEINSPSVAALLAIISYDVQDTVVVMDRVRENSRFYAGRMTYAKMINNSVTETYTRSMNTSVTTIIGILVFMIFGGKTIIDFTLIFFFGLFAGTWSSIYIAAPLLVIWKNLESKYGKNKEVPVQLATAGGPTITATVSNTAVTTKPTQQTDDYQQSYRKGPPAAKRKGSRKRR